jgi:TIR domain
MSLDTLITDYADALFNQRRREIYDQEEEELADIRKNCLRNGMVLGPQYVIEVGKYLVKRTSRLADAKRETLLAAVEKAKLSFDDAVLGEVTSIVLDFCDKQQHREVGFLATHAVHQPGLNNVPGDLKAAVIIRIQTGISGVMETVKDKMTSTRLETLLDAKQTQTAYASTLGKQWDVFISHASEDKVGFVEQLAKALEASGLLVWYDNTALSVGDRLRSKIDEGLAQSRYGIVVLSHHFFGKQWPKEELEGLFAREVSGAPGFKVILPVWHNITAPEVARYSPMLTGRLAANSNAGLDIVVRQLREAMGLRLAFEAREHSQTVLAETKPNITMIGFQYRWLKTDENHIWRETWRDGPDGQKALLFAFVNNPDSTGKGLDACSVRAQITFEWDTGAPGPNFSPVPWLGEELSFVDIPLGVEKKLVIGTGFGPQQGWYGCKSNRIKTGWPTGVNPLESNPIPDLGKMKVRIIAAVDGKSEVIWMSCFSWKVDFDPNHPWFEMISCNELKAV